MALTSHITNSLTSRSFLYGLGAGLSVYALLAGWAYFGGAGALQDQQERLASQTLLIERVEPERPPEIEPAPLNDDEQLDITEAQPNTLQPEDADEDSSDHSPDPEALHQSSMEMRSAPYPGIYETGAKAEILPVINTNDGLTPFHVYRKPFTFSADQKLIALVVDDYGLSRTQSNENARSLPGAVTFILSPYVNDADALRETARSNGHELWLKLPLENENFPMDDPGSKAILSRASLEKNMNNLRWTLSRTSGYTGLALYNDLTFTRTKSTLSAVLKEAGDRGLGLFDMNISAPSQVKESADRFNAPYIKNEIFFHDPKWAGDLSSAAELLETIAESRGYAVGVFKNYPGALDFIENWGPELTRKGFTLAPLSAIYLAQNPAAVKPMPSKLESNDASH